MTRTSSLVLALTSMVCATPEDDANCSIIGGFVYRGRKIPEIQGQYFYSDYCNSWLKSFAYADGKVADEHDWPIGRLGGSVVSYGEDSQGELYICTSSGRVYRIVKNPGNQHDERE